MIKKTHCFTLLSVLLGTLAGCASYDRISQGVTVVSTPHILVPDSLSQIKLDANFQIPERLISSRSRLFITPKLIVDNDSLCQEFFPLILDGSIYTKKLNRKKRLGGYVDLYEKQSVPKDRVSNIIELYYNQILELPKEVNAGRLVAVISADGCGQCTGIDTIDIATISNPITIIDDRLKESMQLSWIEQEFVVRPKIMEERGVANLQFGINQYNIDFNLGNNQYELESMINRLQPILNDTLATLNSIVINGMASADGSLAFNTKLARNRAASAKQWLISELHLNRGVQSKVVVGSSPEGWEPVLAAMIADNNSDSIKLRDILIKHESENDDVQEVYIRRLACWNTIRERYLQKTRKVEYVYSYSLRSFTTDEELLEMYHKRPDAFNEDELLRVAALTNSADERKTVYKTILHYFPQSIIASNNLAILYLRDGNELEAKNILEEQTNYSNAALKTLAAIYVYENNFEMAIELLKEIDDPEARYNLGLIKAKQRKYSEAFCLLEPFGDANTAIVALSLNMNLKAKEIMNTLKTSDSLSAYVRAIIAAREGDKIEFYRQIRISLADEKLKSRAQCDFEFGEFKSDSEFVKLFD